MVQSLVTDKARRTRCFYAQVVVGRFVECLKWSARDGGLSWRWTIEWPEATREVGSGEEVSGEEVSGVGSGDGLCSLPRIFF